MGPQFEWIVDVSISPLNYVWGNLSKEEEKCLHLIAQAYVVLVSALSKGVYRFIVDEYGYLEDAYLLWTKLKEKFDKSIGDDEVLLSREPLDVCSTPSICEDTQVTSSIDQVGLATFTSSPTFELMQGNDMVSRINVDASNSCEEAYDRHRPSEESTSPKGPLSFADENMCFMARSKKRLAKEVESESEDEDLEFGHFSKRDMVKIMKLMKIIQEQENKLEEVEDKLDNQEDYLIKKIEELKDLANEHEKLKCFHTSLENGELKTQLEECASNHVALQEKHDGPLCSHEKLMESHVMLEIAHEGVLTMVRSYQPLTQKFTCSQVKFDLSCANHCCSQPKQSSVEHVLVESYNDLIAKENDDLKQEVEMLKKDLMRMKGKDIAQPSQDNREVMVNKLVKGSTVQGTICQQESLKSKNSNSKVQDQKKKRTHLTCSKCKKEGHHVRDCSLKKTEKDMSKGQKEKKEIAHVKCNKCSILGHYAYMCFNNKNGDCMTSRKRFPGKETS
ncbi:hypothetical protein BS78_09G083500 [Paspalum vaginatum]|nr:hypothetical protein BS78_09G083500 [Paspalum vaginatum]